VFLATDGVELRTIEQADLPRVQAWVNGTELRRATDEQIMPSSAATERAYWLDRTDRDDPFLLVCRADEEGLAGRVELDDIDTVAGRVELDDIDTVAGRADLGLLLAPEADSEEVATRAVPALLGHAFGEPRLTGSVPRRSTGTRTPVASSNRSGSPVKASVGRTRSMGGHRDTVVYGLLASEWDRGPTE
jgi:RimJ/RimL family protein N-acetyltransferase